MLFKILPPRESKSAPDKLEFTIISASEQQWPYTLLQWPYK